MKKAFRELIRNGATYLGQKIEANQLQRNATQMANLYQNCAYQLVEVLQQVSDSNLIKPSVVDDVWALNESNFSRFVFKIDVRKGADEDDVVTLKRRIERRWAEVCNCDIGVFRKRYNIELVGGRLIAHNVM